MGRYLMRGVIKADIVLQELLDLLENGHARRCDCRFTIVGTDCTCDRNGGLTLARAIAFVRETMTPDADVLELQAAARRVCAYTVDDCDDDFKAAFEHLRATLERMPA